MAKRILVVDDDEFVRSLLRDIFVSEGYTVEVVDDGRKGFEKACLEHYDLITMDIRMPNWDGVETILGLNLVNNDLKFIVISGYIEEAKEFLLKKSPHVLKVIEKPFDTGELLTVVKNYFQGANK